MPAEFLSLSPSVARSSPSMPASRASTCCAMTKPAAACRQLLCLRRQAGGGQARRGRPAHPRRHHFIGRQIAASACPSSMARGL
ncbi:hypothetical protein [Comamonas sp. JC664]|uniref:hypothetical protein n=1 Tax=Comamonas sp. JC664 TaxID=2801917 RepID=UPI003606EB0E